MVEIKEFDIPSDTVTEFGQLVKELHDVDANQCYQCRKCTSGCPVVEFMDYTPSQIIHGIRLGLRDMVLNSNTYWFCVACGTCTTRCPQETGLIKIMDSLANIALHEGIKPKLPEVAKFYSIALANIRSFGQMYDLGIVAMLKLRTGNLTQDLGYGLKMLKKGKLELLPSRQNVAGMKRIFDRVKKWEKG